MEFEKKRILITGASSGIGRETAIRMDRLGAATILVARDEKALSDLKDQMQNPCSYFLCDLSDLTNILPLFDKMAEGGKMDGFVHCAGVCKVTPIRGLELEEIMQQMNINTLSFFQLAKLFSMAKYSNNASSIVAMSSYAAYTEEAGMCAYSMSKAALNTEVRVMAKEFLKRRIRVNAIMPAEVMSKMGERDNVWTEEELKNIEEHQPLGAIPIGQIVNCVEFLLSNQKAGYITGECITITGGYKNK